MPTLTVAPDRDRVVLDFGGRRRDLILEPWAGMRLAEEIDRAADQCEAWVRAGGSGQLIQGEPVEVQVKSWDGRINVRFSRPWDRCPVPYQAARELAKRVRMKVTESRFRVHLDIGTVTAVNSSVQPSLMG